MKCKNIFCIYQNERATNYGCQLMTQVKNVKACLHRKAFNRFNSRVKEDFYFKVSREIRGYLDRIKKELEK